MGRADLLFPTIRGELKIDSNHSADLQPKVKSWVDTILSPPNLNSRTLSKMFRLWILKAHDDSRPSAQNPVAIVISQSMFQV